MSDFSVGDVVMLKSGGPSMTITIIDDYSQWGSGPQNGAMCVWFDATKKMESVFDVRIIEKII